MTPGCQATFTFTGSAVSWIGYRDEWSGIARVSVDGVLRAEIDTYASRIRARSLMYTLTGLLAGTAHADDRADRTLEPRVERACGCGSTRSRSCPDRMPPRIAIVAASLDILGGQGIQARALADHLADEGTTSPSSRSTRAFRACSAGCGAFPAIPDAAQ